MSKQIKKITSVSIFLIIIICVIITSISVSAQTVDTTTQKGTLILECDFWGSKYMIYKIGELDTSDSNSNELKFTSNESQITDEILNGNKETLLKYLDETNLTSEIVAEFDTLEGTEKTIDNLEQGIYYIKEVNNISINSVKNEIVTFPHYSNTGLSYTVNIDLKIIFFNKTALSIAIILIFLALFYFIPRTVYKTAYKVICYDGNTVEIILYILITAVLFVTFIYGLAYF